jgi:perosamine synthetase
MTATTGRAQLAIEGGTPVRATRLPYARQTIEADDVEAVTEALGSEFLTTGPKVAAFERAFAGAVGATHAVAVSSGTAALHAAAFAAGIGPHADAITTPLTFAASANCVRYLGGRVIFADVQRESLNLDPSAVERAWTPATRAVITVDYAGLPSDLDELLALCRSRGALLIDDACHALGATYRGRRVGQIADLSTFSLHPAKHITAGEGGVVTTNDDTLAAAVRMFRTHGIASTPQQREREGSWHYDMSALGYNYRITDIQCALAASQLAKHEGWLRRRREIAAAYQRSLGSLPELELPAVLPDRESAWHLFVVRLRLDRLTVDRSQVFRALSAENIGVNVHYIPVPWHSYYQGLGYAKGEWPVAEEAYQRAISLPMFPAMSDADVADVVTAVTRVLARYGR